MKFHLSYYDYRMKIIDIGWYPLIVGNRLYVLKNGKSIFDVEYKEIYSNKDGVIFTKLFQAMK